MNLIASDTMEMMTKILHRLERRYSYWLRMSQRFAKLARIITLGRVKFTPEPSPFVREKIDKFQRLQQELDPADWDSIERALRAILLEAPGLYSPLWELYGLGDYPPDSFYGECQQLFEKLVGDGHS